MAPLLVVLRVARVVVVLAVFGLLIGRLYLVGVELLAAPRDTRLRVACTATIVLIFLQQMVVVLAVALADRPPSRARVVVLPATARRATTSATVRRRGGGAAALIVEDTLLSQEILDVPQQDLLVFAPARDNRRGRAPGQRVIGDGLVPFKNQVWRVCSHLELVFDGTLRDNVPQVDFPTIRLRRYESPILIPDPQAIYLQSFHHMCVSESVRLIA